MTAPQPQTSKHLIMCDECKQLLRGEPYYAIGGRIFCLVCWGNPQATEEVHP